jgi:hypothetical protein
LERVRECHQNINGRNLDQDFAAVAPQTPMGTRSQMGVPLDGVGCTALADHLRAASWPPKFRPHLPEKYDGTSNPSEFLQVYVTAITAPGGNTGLNGAAPSWRSRTTRTPYLITRRRRLHVRLPPRGARFGGLPIQGRPRRRRPATPAGSFGICGPHHNRSHPIPRPGAHQIRKRERTASARTPRRRHTYLGGRP